MNTPILDRLMKMGRELMNSHLTFGAEIYIAQTEVLPLVSEVASQLQPWDPESGKDILRKIENEELYVCGVKIRVAGGRNDHRR